MAQASYIWVPGYTKKNGTKVEGHYRAPTGRRKRRLDYLDEITSKGMAVKKTARRQRKLYPRFFSSQ